MELLLVLEVDDEDAGDRPRHLDVRAEVEPSATVGMLQEALIALAARTGTLAPVAASALGLYVDDATDPLPATVPVARTGLAGGETVVLRPLGSRPRAHSRAEGAAARGLVLDVVGGPDSGRSVVLEPGALSVGRQQRSGLPVRDPTLSRRHFSLQVGASDRRGGLEVVVVPEPAARNGVVVEGELVELSRVVVPGELIRAGDSAFAVREPTAPAVAPGSVAVRRRDLGGVVSPPPPPTGGWSAGRRFERLREEFYEAVEALAARVDLARRDERAERHAGAPDLASLVRWAERGDDGPVAGPMVVRLGLGEVASRITTGIGPGGAAELRAQAKERLAHHRSVPEAPVTVDLAEAGALGLWGDEDQVWATASALVLQAACRHDPEDLVVAVAVGRREELEVVEWLKWLPHLWSPESPLAGAHLAVGPEAAEDLVARMFDVVAERVARHGDTPRVLLAVDELAEVPRRALDRLLDVAAGHGIHVLWCGRSELVVPRQCGAVVACAGHGEPATLQIVGLDGAGPATTVDLDGVQPATARTIARRVLRARPPAPAGALPRRVPLLPAGEPARCDPAALASGWGSNRAAGTHLVATVGASADGPCHVDLMRDGPVLLVGGAPGSGKTEALVAVALSLAARYPPELVRFVVVDHGRGAGTAPLRALPHAVVWAGAAEGPEGLRAALSEPVALAPGGRQVLLVDDLAAVTRVSPWAPGLVTALLGSAGVHAVVTTPYPAEVPVPLARRARARLALRAVDPADAVALAGAAGAAALPVPLRGRGFLRVGEQAPTLVQGVWASAPEPAGAGPRPVEVEELVAGSPGRAAEPGRTQGELLVAACVAAERRRRTLGSA